MQHQQPAQSHVPPAPGAPVAAASVNFGAINEAAAEVAAATTLTDIGVGVGEGVEVQAGGVAAREGGCAQNSEEQKQQLMQLMEQQVN